MKLRTTIVAMLASITLLGCASTTGSGDLGVNRSQLMLVGEAELAQVAKKAYAKMLGKAGAKDTLNTDPKLTNRVRRIGQDVINQVGVYRTDALDWGWEINVFTSDQLNAWCMPGGKIGVFSGIVEKLSLTDDELAALMGHEVSHALREHSREQVSRVLAARFGLKVGAAAAGGVTQDTMYMAGKATEVTFILPNSRTAEREADLMGVELAARAGYDPRAAVSLWQKMASKVGARRPEFISTHPNPKNRINSLTIASEKVLPLYQNALAAKSQ